MKPVKQKKRETKLFHVWSDFCPIGVGKDRLTVLAHVTIGYMNIIE